VLPLPRSASTRAAPRKLVEVGRGSWHGKNAGTLGSEAQIYTERAGQGYSTIIQRLGKVRGPRTYANPMRLPAKTRC